MLWLVNFRNCINVEYYYTNINKAILPSDSLYILDTDDLVVEHVDYNTLFSSILNGDISVENVAIDYAKDSGRDNDVIYLCSEPYDFMDYNKVMPCYDDHIIANYNSFNTSDNTRFTVDFFTGNTPRTLAVEVNYIIDTDGLSKYILKIYNNDNIVLSKSILDPNSGGRYTNNKCADDIFYIPYFFRLGSYIFFKMLIRDIDYNKFHCITLVTFIDGNVLDLFADDTKFFGDLNFKSKAPLIRTKYLTMIKGKF